MKQTHNFDKSIQNISYDDVTSTIQMDLLTIIENANHFEKNIEKKMRQFKKQGISVSTCTEYFDNTIDKYTKKLLRQLETTHSNNAGIIKQYFHRRASEKIRLQNLLTRLDEEIAITTVEYNALKQLVDKSDPLKNTILPDENQKKEDEPNE